MKKHIRWTERVESVEARSLDIDTDKWEEIFKRPFDRNGNLDDDLTIYMNEVNEDAESLDFGVLSRTVYNVEEEDVE